MEEQFLSSWENATILKTILSYIYKFMGLLCTLAIPASGQYRMGGRAVGGNSEESN